MANPNPGKSRTYRVWNHARILSTENLHGIFSALVVEEENKTGPTTGRHAVLPGENVYLEIPTGHNRMVNLDLTRLTEQELIMLREVVNYALDRATPVAKARDEHAAKIDPRTNLRVSERVYRRQPLLVDYRDFTPEPDVDPPVSGVPDEQPGEIAEHG